MQAEYGTHGRRGSSSAISSAVCSIVFDNEQVEKLHACDMHVFKVMIPAQSPKFGPQPSFNQMHA